MRIMARDVAEFVAKRHGLTFDDLYSQRRTRHYARARQIAMYAIRRLCPHMSYPGIGRLLGWRDHTTVIHGVRKIAELMALDYEIAESVRDTLAFFRTGDEPSVPLAAAVQFHALCAQYSQAMKAAA